jgi:hypothetical protein
MSKSAHASKPKLGQEQKIVKLLSKRVLHDIGLLSGMGVYSCFTVSLPETAEAKSHLASSLKEYGDYFDQNDSVPLLIGTACFLVRVSSDC